MYILKKIAVFNQKGGVGKTTTVVNLGAALCKLGKKILLIDIDPQGNTSSGVGINKSTLENTIYDLIIDPLSINDCIIPSKIPNLDIIPANMQLAGAEIEMASVENRDSLLTLALSNLKKQYDYILIDCPPSLGLLSLNALACVDSVLIPIQCEFYALEGVSDLINTIELVRKNLNPSLDVQGVLLTMFDSRTNLSADVVKEVVKYFKEKTYKTMIPRNVRLSEAPSHGKAIEDYDAQSIGARSYKEFAKEFLSTVDATHA